MIQQRNPNGGRGKKTGDPLIPSLLSTSSPGFRSFQQTVGRTQDQIRHEKRRAFGPSEYNGGGHAAELPPALEIQGLNRADIFIDECPMGHHRSLGGRGGSGSVQRLNKSSSSSSTAGGSPEDCPASRNYPAPLPPVSVPDNLQLQPLLGPPPPGEPIPDQ